MQAALAREISSLRDEKVSNEYGPAMAKTTQVIRRDYDLVSNKDEETAKPHDHGKLQVEKNSKRQEHEDRSSPRQQEGRREKLHHENRAPSQTIEEKRMDPNTDNGGQEIKELSDVHPERLRNRAQAKGERATMTPEESADGGDDGEGTADYNDSESEVWEDAIEHLQYDVSDSDGAAPTDAPGLRKLSSRDKRRNEVSHTFDESLYRRV